MYVIIEENNNNDELLSDCFPKRSLMQTPNIGDYMGIYFHTARSPCPRFPAHERKPYQEVRVAIAVGGTDSSSCRKAHVIDPPGGY